MPASTLANVRSGTERVFPFSSVTTKLMVSRSFNGAPLIVFEMVSEPGATS